MSPFSCIDLSPVVPTPRLGTFLYKSSSGCVGKFLQGIYPGAKFWVMRYNHPQLYHKLPSKALAPIYITTSRE